MRIELTVEELKELLGSGKAVVKHKPTFAKTTKDFSKINTTVQVQVKDVAKPLCEKCQKREGKFEVDGKNLCAFCKPRNGKRKKRRGHLCDVCGKHKGIIAWYGKKICGWCKRRKRKDGTLNTIPKKEVEEKPPKPLVKNEKVEECETCGDIYAGEYMQDVNGHILCPKCAKKAMRE